MPKINYLLIKLTLNLPRYAKKIIAIVSDAASCVIATWIAYYLRLEKVVLLQGNVLWAAIISITLIVTIFWIFGLYKTIFRYSGKSEVKTLYLYTRK